MTIRRAHPSDLVYLYEICHQTGDAGKDASPRVADRWILGHYYAAPYLVRDPGWCWTAVDEHGPCGYLVTTPDTAAFTAWMNADWLPAVRALYAGTLPVPRSDLESSLRDLLNRPASHPALAATYPAHLHIDFLPRAQGQGLGTRLLAEFRTRLRAEGVQGFHLGVGAANTGAQAFYAKQGLAVLETAPWGLLLGERTLP